jgi:hypothetical protein
MDDHISHGIAKSSGFHRFAASLHADAVAAGIVIVDYAALFEFLRAHPVLKKAGGLAGVRRYARVICYVDPGILAQWTLQIPRNGLLLLAGMPRAQQMREYQGMAGVRSALLHRARSGAASQSYARQALAQMRVGLSTSEIRELLEMLAHTNVAAVMAALKEENHVD